MEPGDANDNGQKFVRRTGNNSTTHPHAKIWVMRCPTCNREYGCNSCDGHIRRCPFHDGGKPPEPIN